MALSSQARLWTCGHISPAYNSTSSGRASRWNGYIESFNGRLRDECLNVEVFFTLADVRDKLERWRQDYNQVRPHSALRDNAPALFAVQWAETATPDPEPVPAQAGKPAAGKLLEILN